MESNNKAVEIIRGLIRPIVTMAIVLTLIIIVLHGAIWCGDYRFAEYFKELAGIVIAFWFGSRSVEKTIKTVKTGDV